MPAGGESGSRLPRWLMLDARRIDALECIVSVMLAIAVAHAIGGRHVAWAAFSGYMVMRGAFSETLLRGFLRIVGTLAGGLLALLLAPLALGSVAGEALALGLVSLPTLYAAITARRAYAWLFVGLTFQMALLDAAAPGADPIGVTVQTRILEVAAGTLACVAVSLASTLTLRRRWPAAPSVRPPGLGWHADAFRHAAQGAFAVMLLPIVGATLRVPELGQGAVTIMAAMLVPVAETGSGLFPVSRRLAQRAAGCVAGAAFAALVMLVAGSSAAALLTGAALGVGTGRLIENGAHRRTYVGTQFVLALLVTLVPDAGADLAIAPGLSRLEGIGVGLALLEPVLLLCHLVMPRRRASGRASLPDDPGAI